MEIQGPLFNSAYLCMPILRALPDWFGIEEALVHYQREIDHLPTFIAYEGGQAFGFLSIKQHFPQAAELYVMGVIEEMQRRGAGRALVLTAERYLRERSVEYIQVKTLGPSHPDEGYARTRRFYQAMGFVPLEELAQIWDERNPCLILVKKTGSADPAK